MKPHIVIACAATALFAQPATAQEDEGLYVAGFLGAGFPSDIELTGVQTPDPGVPGVAGAPARIESEFDSDTSFGIALGYKTPWQVFGLFHPRLELEASTLQTDVSGGSFNAGTQPFSGDTRIDFFLVNNYSDIIWTEDQTLIPYVGGGLGIANVDANILYAGGGSPTPNFVATGEDSGLASTIAGGLTWLTGADWEVYGEARYYQIYDIELERRFIANGADLLSANVSDDFDGSSLTLGVRYKF
ncbi:MAG: outer membrane beta-barrel protein [Pseudomonadota bacterium]